MASRYQHGGGYFPEQIYTHNTQGFFPNSFPRGACQSSSFTPPQQFGSNQTWSAGSSQQLSLSTDQEFVKQFEKKVMATKHQFPNNTSSSLKMPEARHLLRRAVELINLLKKCSNDGNEVSSQVVCLQSELDSIQRSIQPSLEDLVKKVRGRAKKRARISSRRKQLQADHEKRCRDAHEKADEWLAEKEAKKLKLKMEKEVKLSAANTLLEVETKQSDILRYIKFVELLEQLKSHRLTMRHKSTDQSAQQTDQQFRNTVQSLLEFLSSRKLEYEKERKALHVIMEEEVQDRIAAATATKPNQPPALLEQSPLPDNLQPPSVYALLHVRKQWDVFISPIGTPLPKDSLLPSTPSSSDWETYLVEWMSAIERTTPAGLPPGWRREVVVRKSGQSAGKYDVYYFSPDGKKFRSKPQIVRYLGESVDLNLFDFSGRSPAGGQRRPAKDRPPKRDFHVPRQERPLNNTPMRPAGPIRRTCGVIKLPVMYYPARSTSTQQPVTTGEPQVILGSVIQQLWARRLTPIQPVDSVSGKPISAEPSPPPPPLISQENAGPVTTSEEANLSLSSNNLMTPNKLFVGSNAVKSPPLNVQFGGGNQNNNLKVASVQQPSPMPNHYGTATSHADGTVSVNNSPVVVASLGTTTASPQPHVKSAAQINTPAISTNSVIYSGNAQPAATQGFIPVQHNGQGLLLQSNNVVYMPLPQQSLAKGGNFINSSTKAATVLPVGQQQSTARPQTVPTVQPGLNHSLVTETDIRLQEQKVQLLRQQLGLTS